MRAEIRTTAHSVEDGGVEYVVCVYEKKELIRKVNRRYSDFDRLYFELEWAGFGLLPALPPKTLFSHTSGSVVSDRMHTLCSFLNALIQRADISSSPQFRSFIDCSPISESGLQAESQMDGNRLPLRDFARTDEHKFAMVHGDNSSFARMGKLWQVVEKDELGAFALVQSPVTTTEEWTMLGCRTYPNQANCVASDGGFVVVGTDTGRVLIYDMRSGNFPTTATELELHGTQPVLSVAMKFPVFVSIGLDCALRVYDVATNTLLSGGRLKKRMQTDSEVLTRVKLIDSKLAIIATNKNRLFLYDISRSPNPDLLHTYLLPAATEIGDFIEVSASSFLVAHDCVLSLLTQDQRSTVCAFPGARISRLAKAGDLVAVGTADGVVGVVSLASNSLLYAMRSAYEAEISKVEFLDERRIAAAAEDGRLRVWKITGSLVPEVDEVPQEEEGRQQRPSAALLAADEEDDWKKEIFL
jgi:hypothetical protein